VPLSSLIFGDQETFTQATTGANPLVTPQVFGYNPATNKYFGVTSLEPDQGYWVHANTATAMQIPPPE
jgi:hypothetical protein